MREWLKAKREKKNFTLEQMAEWVEVPLTTYRSYETGERNPTVKQAKRLAKKLRVKWTIFFENQ